MISREDLYYDEYFEHWELSSQEMDEFENTIYNQALEDLFNLAKQNAYDDGVGYSIGIGMLDELVIGLKKINILKEKNNV